MSKSPSSKLRELRSSSFSPSRDHNGAPELDDPEDSMATVAHFIEKLHSRISSQHEKELITARLLGLAKARKEARAVIGTHVQAMPLFISILRTGTLGARINVAATLSVLCRDEDLRIKVLLGGCIPPLLSLLRSETTDARKAAAEAIYEVSSGRVSDDHVGMNIFVTEGVVLTLWEQLNPKKKEDNVVQGFVTGALRNLCGDKDNYWRATLEAGGVDIIVALLSSDNAAAQSNAASLLARLILAFSDSIPKVIESGAVKALLQLVGQNNDISVRASAADALEALSSKSVEAKKVVIDADGINILIGAIVAPSKECMQGESGHSLQGLATRALANICGGMPALVLYLGELSQSSRLAAPVADIIGALAYALMVFEENSGPDVELFNSTKIEDMLVNLLKPRDNKLFQERILEAMASLYGNIYLSRCINYGEAKRVLIGLITMAAGDAQEYLILSLTSLCRKRVSIWEAVGEREGIQLLISLLGLSCEQHQEYAVLLLAILTDQVDDSKWAITAAGGIPPLVQLLEVGSQKAREDAARVLWNLSCHTEDIRACVETAGAVPAFLWLLKSGGPKGQEASAMALSKLVLTADSATINQLLALLLGDSPGSKVHILKVLGHVLTMASHKDLVKRGSAANKALKSLIQILNSSNEETQECAASVLADLFSSRQDICESLATDEIVQPCMKLLTSSNTQVVAAQLARALGALSRPIKTKTTSKIPHIAEGDVKPLIRLTKTSSSDTAETAVAALANLLSDPQIAAEALAEDVVAALTRVLGEGTLEGKKNASQALHQLLKHFPVGDVLRGNSQCRFSILAILDSLKAMDMSIDCADAFEVVALLARTKQGVNFAYPPWTALAEAPASLEALVCCLAEGPPSTQDKAIEILSRLCGDQPVLLGDLLIARSKAISSLANRIMNSSRLEVRVGGAALLICVAKQHRKKSMEALNVSGYMKPLTYSLVDLMKQNSSSSSLEIEVRTPRGFFERSAFQEVDEFDILDPAIVFGGTVALWLLAIMCSFHSKNKLSVMEAGGLETLCNKLSSYTLNPKAEFDDTEGIWISSLLLAILFQEENVVLSPTTIRIIPLLAQLLKSDEAIDRFFAAQALASLVRYGNKGISLAIANSGAVARLIVLVGYTELNMPNLVALSDEFALVQNPDQVILEHLFEIEDVRLGSIAHKSIPLLVDLLRPIPDRPGAPPVAVRVLSHIAEASDANKLLVAEAGALDALPKYLSLSPQESTEASVSELLRILFTNPDLIRHEASLNSLGQLIAVLHLGSRNARLSAARALHELFNVENIRDSESARQAVQPLLEMLNAASESEQEAAILALVKLTSANTSKATLFVDVEGDPPGILYKILSSASSLELKKKVAQLCFILFSTAKFRANPVASECIEPFMSLMQSDTSSVVEAGVCALERLLNDEHLVELAAAYDVMVDLLVGLISGTNYRLIEGSISALIKLGKDRAPRKLEMVKAGAIDKCLDLLSVAPSSLCSAIAELFRILTNSGAIARSSDAAKIVEPLFMVLLRPDFSLWGQHSTLQALVNILEKPQSLATLQLTPSQVVEPLISFLESPSQAIQQLGTELLSHLLAQEHFQQDITTKNAVVPLVRLAGIGILNLQQTAIQALEKISISWPKAVADAGGIFEIAKVIIQDDPKPSLELWETAGLVLSNVLNFNAEYYFKVPLLVLTKMLHSNVESTIKVALNALIIHEKTDASSGEQWLKLVL